MESIEAAARDYRDTLAELKNNNKTQINLLTILAEDFKDAATQIVDVIEMHLNTCSPSQKLPVLYVCDSILKNVGKPNEYDSLFSRKIINMFENVFRQGCERTRAALYKLRVTWASTGLFIPSKLYALDMKINKLDSAWPISNPNTGRALRHDPQVTLVSPQNRPSSATSNGSSVTSPSSSTRVFVNPKFIDASATASNQSTKKNMDKTKSSTNTTVKEKQIKKEPKQDPLDKLLPSSSSGSVKSAQSPAGSKRKSTPAEHSNAPIRKKQQQPQTQKTSLDEDLRSINLSNKKPMQIQSLDQDFRPKALKPTSVIGSHAFASPSIPPPVRTMAAPTVPPTHFVPLPPHPVPGMSFHHGSQQHQPQQQLGLPVNIGGYHHNSPPQDPAPMAPPVQVAPPQQYQQQVQQKNVYSSEQTKLDLPANNRIFVDGKAYEVMFVDDTAVIERAGAPHRIYFAGPPRNLIIDGIPHLLPFDKPTQIDIFGAKHTVKFGAPSRELYIGGHPFKGQFGGPPIIATINGRRHEIRLTGSAPEVRIEPEPAYHLTHFLHKMREEKKIEIASEKPEKKEDWLSYLKNLRNSGILPKAQSSSSPRQSSPPMNASTSAPNNGGQRGGRQRHQPQQSRWGGQPAQVSTQPSDPSPIGNGVERRNAPPAAITDFNIRLLQIRYDSVVEALVTKRSDACKFCGMRLDDSQGKSKEWQDHMDWHVKQNLARHGSNSSAAAVPYRQWYPSTSTWLTPRASDHTNEQAADKPDEPLPGVASSGVKTKECSVCGEKFDEYFDDDEETWRLRDTVSIHGKIVHSACASDATQSMENTAYFNDSDIVKKEEPFDGYDE